MSGSDNEDDWYFDSITRYHNLNMFEVENTPFHVQFMDENVILMASTCTSSENHSELLQLLLPEKSISTIESSSSDVDLKLKCGVLTESVITQVRAQFKKSKVFTSEKDVSGVVVYDTNTDSGQINKIKQMQSSLVNPQVDLNYWSGSQIILTQDSNNNSFLVDINTGKEYMTLNTVNTLNRTCDRLIPLFLQSDNLLFLSRKAGEVKLFDLRVNTVCNNISMCPVSDVNFWTCSSDSIPQTLNGCEQMAESYNQRIFLLSDNGALVIYDSRNLNSCVEKHSLPLKRVKRNSFECVQLKCYPFDKNIISVSGFDNNVYVYSIGSGLEELFVHDGHSHVENCNKESVAGSHTWAHNGRKQVLSSSYNKTLQLWDLL